MGKVVLWVFFGIMALAAIGNLIGGTDTPVTARVDPAAVATPVAPRFDETLFVSASALNLRDAPSSEARVLARLTRNTKVRAGERRNGWVLVSANGEIGWVSGEFLSAAPGSAEPVLEAPQQSAPQVVGQQSGWSCSPRKTCSQIGSCGEAMAYLEQCSWGGRLDSDDDGVPCESICR